VVDAPRLALEEYGKYGGLLACADWRAALAAPAVVLHTLFGLPTAYLSRRHAPYVRETFGPYAFPLLHAFLHRPAAAVRAVAGALHAEHLAGAGCSVGLQIRWHHLRAYLAPDEVRCRGWTARCADQQRSSSARPMAVGCILCERATIHLTRADSELCVAEGAPARDCGQIPAVRRGAVSAALSFDRHLCRNRLPLHTQGPLHRPVSSGHCRLGCAPAAGPLIY
jgi:hypothetical protein